MYQAHTKNSGTIKDSSPRSIDFEGVLRLNKAGPHLFVTPLPGITGTEEGSAKLKKCLIALKDYKNLVVNMVGLKTLNKDVIDALEAVNRAHDSPLPLIGVNDKALTQLRERNISNLFNICPADDIPIPENQHATLNLIQIADTLRHALKGPAIHPQKSDLPERITCKPFGDRKGAPVATFTPDKNKTFVRINRAELPDRLNDPAFTVDEISSMAKSWFENGNPISMDFSQVKFMGEDAKYAIIQLAGMHQQLKLRLEITGLSKPMAEKLRSMDFQRFMDLKEAV